MAEQNENRPQTNPNSEGGPSSDTRDLKEREYRDNEGNVHHHTHTAGATKNRDEER
jgi:hypothetical protein